MLKDKSKKTEEPGVADALKRIAQRLDDQDAQIQLLLGKHSDDGGARKIIADLMYNTPRDRLSEFSIIPNSAIEAFCLSKTCGSVLDADVLNGKLSLCEIQTDEAKRLFRGRAGQLLKYGAEQAKEEAQKEREKLGEQADMGEGM